MQQKSRRAEELSYLNAIACLMVVFIHVTSYGIVHAAPDSVQAALVYFPWRLAACVVPVFLFSSAVKMAFQYEEHYTLREYAGYVAGRVRSIYLPYAGWNLIYYVVFVLLGYYSVSVLGFTKMLVLGSMSAPFYYIVLAMQFYLLKPLWFWIIRHLRWYVAIPSAVIVTFLSLYLNAFLGLCGINFPYIDRIFATYLVFWVVGLYAGRHWEQLTESLAGAGKSVALAAGIVLLTAVIPYLQYAKGIWLVDTTYHKVLMDLLSIIVLLWVSLKLRGAGERVRKCLMFISSASFFIYLSHCLFLTLTEHFLPLVGVTKISVVLVIRALVCYGVPLSLYALIARLQAVVGARSAKSRVKS